MRPLKEILPIVRTFLWDGVEELEHQDVRVCYAADSAEMAKKITNEEYRTIHACISGSLGDHVFLTSYLWMTGVTAKRMRPYDPAYVPFRDKWLDDLQLKLEKQS